MDYWSASVSIWIFRINNTCHFKWIENGSIYSPFLYHVEAWSSWSRPKQVEEGCSNNVSYFFQEIEIINPWPRYATIWCTKTAALTSPGRWRSVEQCLLWTLLCLNVFSYMQVNLNKCTESKCKYVLSSLFDLCRSKWPSQEFWAMPTSLQPWMRAKVTQHKEIHAACFRDSLLWMELFC